MSDLPRYLMSRIPDQAALMALEPEELAEHVLGCLATRPASERTFSIHNELLAFRSISSGQNYPDAAGAQLACAEAFAWLKGQGLIINEPGGSGGWCIVSRRGLRLGGSGFADYRAAARLPKELLHESIREPAWRAFLRGDYDVAVFTAFKAVEIAVRDAAGLPDLLGVKLARAAFAPDDGPLTDQSVEAGERQARSDLFAGALGSFKNPQSHRHVALEDPAEATEALILASHLLRIVDGLRSG